MINYDEDVYRKVTLLDWYVFSPPMITIWMTYYIDEEDILG